MHARRALAAVVVIVWAAAGCSSGGGSGRSDTSAGSDAPPAADGGEVPEIDWDDCGEGECGTLRVPLDWEDPDGEQIDVAVSRFPARDAEERIGVLVVNPGGPGFPATRFAPAMAASLPEEITDRFDIVGFDSRGTGGTIPVDCTDDLDDVYALDPTPDSAADRRARDEVGGALAESCVEEAGDVLPWVSTERTARDLDLIRRALGEEQLNLLGYSYGTFLGATYADLYPDRVRAFVLDGAVDPTLDGVEQFVQQAGGGEAALVAFLDDCASDPACPFDDGSDLLERFDELMASIDDEPLPAGDGRELGPGEAHLGVFGSLFSEGSWPALAQALADAAAGDGEALHAAFSFYVSRSGDGRYEDVSDAYWAISTLDGVIPTELEGYDEILRSEPRLGPAIVAENLMTAYWPVSAEREPGPFVAEGSAPILVISTTRDPATPYEAGVSLARQLDAGVLLTYEGDGHTVYGNGVRCIDDLVDAYLVALEVPPDGTTC